MEKGTAEDEMVREHHRLNGQEFEQTTGDSGGQRSLASYSPLGCKESTQLSDRTATLPPLWSIEHTAAAAKLRQLRPSLCDPIDGSPPGSAVPGIL